MWASWQLLFGPGTEQLTYGIIASSASWAVLVSFAEKKVRWLTLTTWAILAFLPAGDIEKALLHVFPAAMILLPIGVVLFLVWLVWHETAVKSWGLVLLRKVGSSKRGLAPSSRPSSVLPNSVADDGACPPFTAGPW